jgi:hypothetical protein
MCNIEYFFRVWAWHYVVVKMNSPHNKYYLCLVLHAVQRPTRLANCTPVPRATGHTGIENFPQPRPLKMKVTEKLDQAELSISSWDSSEWAHTQWT